MKLIPAIIVAGTSLLTSFTAHSYTYTASWICEDMFIQFNVVDGVLDSASVNSVRHRISVIDGVEGGRHQRKIKWSGRYKGEKASFEFRTLEQSLSVMSGPIGENYKRLGCYESAD